MDWWKLAESLSWRGGGIRRRLLIWGLGLLGLALIVNTFAGSIYTRRQIKKAAAELQAEVGSLVARRISAFVSRKLERLSDAVVAMSLHELGSDGQKLLAQLLLKNDRDFTEITVLDIQGMEALKLSERRVYLPAELSDQGASEKFNKAFKGENYTSPVYTSDKAEPYVTLAVPMKVTPRQVIGVVSVEASLKSLWDFIGQVEFGRAGYAYVVDGQGNLIAHKDPSLVLKRTDLSQIEEVQEFLQYPTADPTPGGEGLGIMGKRVLSTYAQVPNLGWAVVLEEPVDVALAELRKMERYASLLLGLGLLVGAVIIIWVSNKITEPIRELHRGVEVIGQGNLDHRVEIRTEDEIGQLAQEFNKMAAELKVSYAMLERRVEHRTRQLSALYDVTATVNQSLGLEPVLEEVIKKITAIFAFDATRVFLFDSEMEELHMRASFETHPELWAQVRTFRRGQGIIGKVAQSGEPIIFENIQADRRYWELSQTKVSATAGCSFFAVLPIRTKLQTVGTVLCIGKQPRRLTSEEIQVITSMADQIGVAVEKANLFEETVARAKELSALYDVTATVNQSLDPDVVLREVVHKVLELTHFDAARIYLVDPDGKELRLQMHHGISPEFASKSAADPVGVGISGSIVMSGKPAIFEDILTDPLYAARAGRGLARQEGYRSYISFPLKSKEKTVGVMNFLSRRVQRFLPRDSALLSSMANGIGVALENAGLFEQTVQRASQISALYDVTVTVNQSLDLDSVLQQVSEKIREIFRFDTTRTYLLDPETGELHIRASYPADREDMNRVRLFRLGEGIVGKVAESGEPMIFEDLSSDPRYQQLSSTKNTEKTGHRFLAAFPITAKLRSVGAIVCNGRMPRRLTPSEIQLITSMAGQIGVAVENAKLFSETKQKSLELQDANRELQEANRAKADFLAAMSHELRTPLNVIIGNADLCKDGFFGNLTEKQKEALEKILRYSMMLLRLINDVLALTKIEAKKMSLNLSTFDVGEVVVHVQNYAEQLNRDNHLHLLWEVEPDLRPLTTDALKLEEILQNLIGNAFKFTPKGSIAVRVREDDGTGRVEFVVADTGIGIKQGDLEKIFDEFHQLEEAHTGNYTGVGLGLSIVKKYLDLMGGEIKVESEPGAGTTFTFTLPYSI